MGTAVIVLILALIGVIAVRSYSKKLTSGCCGADGDSEKKVRVKDKNINNYPYAVKIDVEGMHCKNCSEHLENMLNSEDGVWASVNFKNKEAIVHMKQKLSDSELMKIVARAGYFAKDIAVIEKN